MRIFQKTDVGLIRSDNQDAFGQKVLSDKQSIAVVCDGMGGASGGNVASDIAVKAILGEFTKELPQNLTDAEIKRTCSDAISIANAIIYNISSKEESLSGMGTTVVMAVMIKNKAHIFHAGDSRAYLFHKNTSETRFIVDSGSSDHCRSGLFTDQKRSMDL